MFKNWVHMCQTCTKEGDRSATNLVSLCILISQYLHQNATYIWNENAMTFIA